MRILILSTLSALLVACNPNSILLNGINNLNPKNSLSVKTFDLLKVNSRHASITLSNGNIMFIGGGDSPDAGYISSEIYNPYSGSLSSGPELNIDRKFHEVFSLGNGVHLVMGGYNESGRQNNIEIYRESLNSFVLSSVSFGGNHYGSSSVVLASKNLFISGGQVPGGSTLSSSYIYNTSNDSISTGPNLNIARYNHSTTLLDNGKILIAGGRNSSGPVDQVEIYDPSNGVVMLGPSLLGSRIIAPSLKLSSGRVVFIGGVKANFAKSAAVEIYDPVSNTISSSPLLSADIAVSAIYESGSKIVMIVTNNSGPLDNRILIYDPITLSEQYYDDSFLDLRKGHNTIMLQNGDLLITGGEDDNEIYFSDTKFFSPSTKQFY